MRSFWREWLIVVAGQAVCVSVGVWFFGAQVHGLHTQPQPPLSDADAAQQLLGLGIATVVWLTLLQGMTSYLVMSAFRERLDRRNVQSAHENMRQLQQYVRARDAIIFGLAKLAESRDPDTGRHLERITDYTRLLAEGARNDPQFHDLVTPEFIRLVQLSAALHDIGKVGVADSILRKPGPLSQAERQSMQQHALIATSCLDEIVRRVGPSPLLRMAREIALGHHEHWDGCGYPFGLKGEQIPLAARIVAIADVYDALTTTRPYKGPYSHREAAEYVKSAAGTHFDPGLVRVWLSVESQFEQTANSTMGERGQGIAEAPEVDEADAAPGDAADAETVHTGA